MAKMVLYISQQASVCNVMIMIRFWLVSKNNYTSTLFVSFFINYVEIIRYIYRITDAAQINEFYFNNHYHYDISVGLWRLLSFNQNHEPISVRPPSNT